MTNKELIASFHEMCGGNLECMVSNASKTLLLEMGLKSSEQRIVVIKGRWSEMSTELLTLIGLKARFTSLSGAATVISPCGSGNS